MRPDNYAKDIARMEREEQQRMKEREHDRGGFSR